MGEKSYLIRYGVMSHVGRFPALPTCDQSLERGQLVVIQTDRGLELGEVLIATDGTATHPGNRPDDANGSARMAMTRCRHVSPSSPHVLRAAGPDDLSRSRSALAARSGRFSLCQRILEEGNWPWELVDVEPLLDGQATVLHYLGPHQIDVASLRARFRVECAIDVVLEPVGEDVGPEFSEEDADPEDAGGCGSCGCGEGGGCGKTSGAVAEPVSHGHGAETAVTACATVIALGLFLVRNRAIAGRSASCDRLKQAQTRIRDRSSDRSVRRVFTNRIRGHTTMIMLARVGLLIELGIDLRPDDVEQWVLLVIIAPIHWIRKRMPGRAGWRRCTMKFGSIWAARAWTFARL